MGGLCDGVQSVEGMEGLSRCPALTASPYLAQCEDTCSSELSPGIGGRGQHPTSLPLTALRGGLGGTQEMPTQHRVLSWAGPALGVLVPEPLEPVSWWVFWAAP